MFARVSKYTGDPDELNRGFQTARDDLQQIEGFSQAYFCVDRGSGKGLTITLWENEQALEASAQRAQQLRSQATEPSGATIDSVEHYEVTQTVP
jgi:heme-degrading monooxygenase HmoA